MNKAELRKKYKFKRSELSSSDVNVYSEKIFKQILKKFDLKEKRVHVFLPIEKFNEVNTSPFIHTLYDLDCDVATSITHFDPLRLSHCIINLETTFNVDKFGIPTPADAPAIEENMIDFVIIPLLTFDKTGARVGYGKGLYDMFLSKCKDDCVKIGVSFFPPTHTISDIKESDISLDYCVTPGAMYYFK